MQTLELRHPLLYGFGHPYRVDPALLLDGERHGGTAVDPVERASFLERFSYAGQVGDPHGPAASGGHDGVQYVVHVLSPIGDRERPFASTLTDRPGLPHQIQPHDAGPDHVGRQTQSEDLPLVQLDAQKALASTAHHHLSHPVDLLEAGFHDFVHMGA